MATDYYADSSFLVSLYRKDANRAAASRFMAKYRPALSFSPLNRIELRNALRNAAAQGVIDGHECRAAFRQITHDLDEALLIPITVEWTRIFRRADELSEQFAARDGQRTIDLLHVAVALDCKARNFLSFDRRQRRLAEAAGLRVRP